MKVLITVSWPYVIIGVKRSFRFIFTAKKVVIADCGLKGLQIILTFGKEFGLDLAIIIPIMIQHRVQPSDTASHIVAGAGCSIFTATHDCSQLRTLVTT